MNDDDQADYDWMPCVDCPHPDACGDYGCGKECGVVDADGEMI